MKTPKTVEQYIKSYPKTTQEILKNIRALIKKEASGATEGMSYGLVGYKMNGKPLVYFGGWKSHIGFYATPSGHKSFKKELKGYVGAKGSVKFPLNEPMPYGLIKRMVKFRVKENSSLKKK